MSKKQKKKKQSAHTEERTTPPRNQTYSGYLGLDWYKKERAILMVGESDMKRDTDEPIPGPRLHWVNEDGALFYEIDESEGKGKRPYWVDRNDIRVKEPRPLIHQKTFVAEEKKKQATLLDQEFVVQESKTRDDAIPNMLIKGDNLLALNTLVKMLQNRPEEEKVKCIYIDPPYNTGSAFEHYDDNLEHSEWLTLMRDRLLRLRALLRSDGHVCVHVDDSEGPYLKLLLDDIFGRSNHVVTLFVRVRYTAKTLKQDSAFHKQIEQVHVYRNSHAAKPILPEEPHSLDKFKFYIREIGPGKEVNLGGRLVRIFQDGEYVIEEREPSEMGLKEIWATGSILDGNSSGRFFRDHLEGRASEDGLGCLYKVPGIGDDRFPYRYFTGPRRANATKGKYYQGVPVEQLEEPMGTKTRPIENFADMADSFGNCRHEGGVEFRSGKKPERLLMLLLERFTETGDKVLDCFAGSGTTLATAHKMGRSYVGVEIGSHADTHIVPRLKKVLSGEEQSGISKAVGWEGGGAFQYFQLGDSILSKGGKDFNWSLGIEHISESLLYYFDFTRDETIALSGMVVGFDKRTESAGIVCVRDPKKDRNMLIGELEITNAVKEARKKYGECPVKFITNCGHQIPGVLESVQSVSVPSEIVADLD